ncbi:hypothetical protein [Acinetobacter courvalinii]|uniref:hypothetical protein n=1 Tax=Acinetobacter courvalinii TaxID=280147 RepID=UPI0002D13202|nr:hypothetical protein [Acinetobacter courvalinii]ENX06246.1 hypothetical protein F898_03192 [Acinetobacter courvalinii]
MKEIEKYVGFYLLVYICVLIICGFFQYFTVCQGKSLQCNFSMGGINSIITTTAYVITPLIAIIGFSSWKKQYNLETRSNKAKEILVLYEKAFYILLTLENHYQLAQFELKKIMLTSENNDEKTKKALLVYKNLESSMNKSLLDVESQLDWILFRVTTLAMMIKSPDLLAISMEAKKRVSSLLKPIRDRTNQTVSNKEFDRFYKEIANNAEDTAQKILNEVITVIKKYIEA